MPTFITRDYAVSDKRGYGISTYYESVIGSLCACDNEDDAGMLQKHSGQLSKLRVMVITSGDSDDATVTLLKKEPSGSWQNTDLSVTIDQSVAGLYENNSDSVGFSDGDLLCWEIVSNTGINNSLSIRSIIVQVADPD